MLKRPRTSKEDEVVEVKKKKEEGEYAWLGTSVKRREKERDSKKEVKREKDKGRRGREKTERDW